MYDLIAKSGKPFQDLIGVMTVKTSSHFCNVFHDYRRWKKKLGVVQKTVNERVLGIAQSTEFPWHILRKSLARRATYENIDLLWLDTYIGSEIHRIDD